MINRKLLEVILIHAAMGLLTAALIKLRLHSSYFEQTVFWMSLFWIWYVASCGRNC